MPTFRNRSQFQMNEEEQKLVEEHMTKARYMILGSIVFVLLFAYIHAFIVDLAGSTTAEDIPDFGSKLSFLIRFQTINVSWLMFSLYCVIFKRLGTPAVNPENGYEHLVKLSQQHLTNTLEHFILCFCSQLVLIVYLEAATIIKLIPAINLLFIIGRITFWLGYPKYRAFGFMLSNIPIVVTILYCFFQFFIKY